MVSINPAVAKHSLFCLKTLQSMEVAPFWCIITDSFLENIVLLADPHTES